MKKFTKYIITMLFCIIAMNCTKTQAYENNDYLKKSMYYHMKQMDTEFKFIYDGDINSAIKLVDEASKYGSYTHLNVTYCKMHQYGNQFTANITYYVDKSKDNYVNSVIDNVISSNITDDMTTYDKVSFVNKYLIENLEYDKSMTSYDPYTALTTGKTVCQGYSMIASKMYDKLGIPNEIVIGNLKNESHGWNRVNIGGRWYNIDSTNCDALGDEQCLFLKSDAYFKYYGFTWDENSVKGKADCNYKDISHKNDIDNVLSQKPEDVNRWYKLNDNWYYRDLEGNNAVGWFYDSGKWYYLNSDGSMKTGWLKYKDNWYYFNTDGSMQTGKKLIDGKWNYFNQIGELYY